MSKIAIELPLAVVPIREPGSVCCCQEAQSAHVPVQPKTKKWVTEGKSERRECALEAEWMKKIRQMKHHARYMFLQEAGRADDGVEVVMSPVLLGRRFDPLISLGDVSTTSMAHADGAINKRARITPGTKIIQIIMYVVLFIF